ncbi:hypothetical protein B0T10DRAFT_471603 [Thelonectria olida]|uniref:Uncharacterized protein n=1 Tax=Thelonectria olida TaxID=1576542 RepID=A0A9P8WN48_9HYPO|nr:hypothetical protein B0T10DRAFT_471603 [Thelonectria olida]
MFSHARTAFKAGELAFPDIWTLTQKDVIARIRKIPKFRNRVTETRLSLADAMAISRTHRKVTELTDAFFKNCHLWGDQEFGSLRASLQMRGPSSSEWTRVGQAIYLFEILTKIFGKMPPRPRNSVCDGDEPSTAVFEENMDGLHHALVRYALAPWELHQVLSITSFFRRMVDPDPSKCQPFPVFSSSSISNIFAGKWPLLSEINVPRCLGRGLDFIHEAICLTDDKGRAEMSSSANTRLDGNNFEILGMVLSRGVGDIWTRQLPGRHLVCTPFFKEEPALDRRENIQMWRNIEALQLQHTNQPPIVIGGAYVMEAPERIEGRLDLWSAALWDPARWPCRSRQTT